MSPQQFEYLKLFIESGGVGLLLLLLRKFGKFERWFLLTRIEHEDLMAAHEKNTPGYVRPSVQLAKAQKLGL